MSDPGRYEDRVTCFCGHGLFDHDNYGPCAHCTSCLAWTGCLVVGKKPAGDGSTP